MRRLVYIADLKEDLETIECYKNCHKNVPKDVLDNIPDNGVLNMEIYCIGNRLINIIEVDDSYSVEAMTNRFDAHHAIKKWDKMTRDMMKALPFDGCGSQWELTDRIYCRKNKIR